MARKRYSTDLSDAQGKRIAPLIPPPKPGGRPRTTDMREVMNAIFDITRAGCGWRMLPHDFPHWRTVYEFYACWRDDGTWGTINARLREQVRRRAGRMSEPRIGVLDSQSVKTSDQAGHRGFDAAGFVTTKPSVFRKGPRKKAALAR